MGKKSKQGNRAKSAHSFLNIQKNGKILKNKSSRTKKNIKKLFEHLRNESDSSTTIGSNNTVIEVADETKQENENVTSSFIIVGGDNEQDLIINNTPCPIKCSTPLSSKHSLKRKSPLRTNNNSNSAENFQQEVAELTKEINRDSYLTIDLTTESTLNATNNQHITVIDLANTTDNHTLSNQSLSMSGDSDVTVINTKRRKDRLNSAQMKNFASGIAKMDSSERGKLLELITQTIFNGCNGPNSKVSLHSLKNGVTRATETVENTYIKEVILGQASSRNSIGSNIYNPERDIRNKTGLRMIVIDGSNVALQHSKGRVFSVKGLKICIDYFVRRGHVVKAFVPQFRCKLGKSTNGKLLDQLERQGLVVYTPSREIQGRMITSYDDRYIVQCAAEFDGVIVSGDNYRDLLRENPRWRHVIENRLLQFTWVGDMIMFPRDPLGRNGPTLEQFLRHPPTV